MKPDGSGYRCRNKVCTRPRVSNKLAFTPFTRDGVKKEDPDYQMFARLAYAHGCKLQNDSAVHMTRRTTDSARTMEEKVSKHDGKIKIALAWSEVKHAEGFKLENEIMEVDSGRTGSRKNETATERASLGRTLVLRGRFSKQWAVVGLKNRTTPKKGRGGGGPETTDEVVGPIRQAAGTGIVLSPEGGRAFHAAGRLA